MRERRQYIRLRRHLPGTFRVIDPEGRPVDSEVHNFTTRDISSTGMGITPMRLPSENISGLIEGRCLLEVTLELAKPTGVFRAWGAVPWAGRGDGGDVQLGIRFQHVSEGEASRMQAYIRETLGWNEEAGIRHERPWAPKLRKVGLWTGVAAAIIVMAIWFHDLVDKAYDARDEMIERLDQKIEDLEWIRNHRDEIETFEKYRQESIRKEGLDPLQDH